MEFTQFISYLDYGVLGLSAIILILSFVLLSREQKRDIFRPEVEKAIRRYMMLALAFAGVGLISTVVDGVFVTPAKAEKERQDQRMDLLSNMVSEEMARRMLEQNGEISGIKNVKPLVEASIGDSVVVDTIAEATKPTVNPKDAQYQKVKEDVFLSFYNFRADKELFEKSLDKLGKENREIADEKAQILGDYDDLANMKKEWLEKKAIPAMKESIKKGNENPKVIVDLPIELTATTTVPKKVVVSNLDMLESELKLLKLAKEK
ncbi:MAG: hypothetical protein ACI94Y_002654 [Maribacter sp.]|jgi:hypothetical protein